MGTTRIEVATVEEYTPKRKLKRSAVNCKKCNEPIPAFVVINGVVRNLKLRKYCLVCSPFGEGNCKKLHLLTSKEHKICPLCKQEKLKSEFYTVKDKGRNVTSSYCKPCTGLDSAKRSSEVKRKQVEYKGGKCVVCGYDKCIEALDFHHVDPEEKDYTMSESNGNFENSKHELDKTVLVCATCHREVHIGWHQEIINKHKEWSCSMLQLH